MNPLYVVTKKDGQKGGEVDFTLTVVPVKGSQPLKSWKEVTCRIRREDNTKGVVKDPIKR